MRLSFIILLIAFQLFTLNEVIKRNEIIANQNETIEQLTVKYIGTKEEQQLLKEANMQMKGY